MIGGYGLFGVIATVTLRLGERRKLRRLVNILDVDEAVPAFYRRVAEGCLYGDFQYAIEPGDDDFLRRGVLACYAPAPARAEVTDSGAHLAAEEWVGLLRLALTDKRRALQLYSQHYLSTHGNVYWSDTMQLSTYVPSYVELLGRPGDGAVPGESLVIGEMYTPSEHLLEFLDRSRRILRETGAEDIYGTIRAIRRDETTDRDQVERAYPEFPEFLRLKRAYDPELRFQSDWWRHYAGMFE